MLATWVLSYNEKKFAWKTNQWKIERWLLCLKPHIQSWEGSKKNDNKPIYRKQRHHETSQLDNEIFEERPQALKDNSFYSKRNNF